MSWNHRVMRATEDGEESYSIREVFYDDEGHPEMWTSEPMDPYGETLEELREDLARMTVCLDKPVLDEGELLSERRRRRRSRREEALENTQYFTSHGHSTGVPVRPDVERPSRRARCGGPGMCTVCSQEALAARLQWQTKT